MIKNKIEINVKDGSKMNCYISKPDESNQYPAIIVFQEAFGVNSHIRNITDRLAEQGYIAIAPELYHRTAPGFECAYTEFSEKGMPQMQALTDEGLINDIKAVYDYLQKDENTIKEKIGSIGFCLGGKVSFLANSEIPLSVAISYYGGGMHMIAELASKLHGPQLLFWGGKDMHITKEHRDLVVQNLDNAGKDYINTVISYADHGFNCDERASYHPKAAKESWAMTLEFLKNNLK